MLLNYSSITTDMKCQSALLTSQPAECEPLKPGCCFVVVTANGILSSDTLATIVRCF